MLEHVTTADGVDYVGGGGANLAGTITVHHLMLNRNHLLAGGIRPHFYCLPVVKRERHRLALRARGDLRRPPLLPRHRQRAAPRSTPRRRPAAAPASSPRRSRCPGSAQVFDEEGALDRLEAFASLHGPAFYGLPPNEARSPWRAATPVAVAPAIETGAGPVRVFDPGAPLHWRVHRVSVQRSALYASAVHRRLTQE